MPKITILLFGIKFFKGINKTLRIIVLPQLIMNRRVLKMKFYKSVYNSNSAEETLLDPKDGSVRVPWASPR